MSKQKAAQPVSPPTLWLWEGEITVLTYPFHIGDGIPQVEIEKNLRTEATGRNEAERRLRHQFFRRRGFYPPNEVENRSGRRIHSVIAHPIRPLVARINEQLALV